MTYMYFVRLFDTLHPESQMIYGGQGEILAMAYCIQFETSRDESYRDYSYSFSISSLVSKSLVSLVVSSLASNSFVEKKSLLLDRKLILLLFLNH